MFADIGHGFILFMIGIYLCFFAESIKKSDSAFKVMVPARCFFFLLINLFNRYLIILMGFFAFYNGIIYNDFLSIPLNLFGSCFFINTDEKGNRFWDKHKDCTYSFGLDPVWAVSENSLTFINPYKMKV